MRISAVKDVGEMDNLLCIFLYVAKNYTIVKAYVKDMQRYESEITVAYINCPLTSITDVNEVPLYVDLVIENALSPGHKIRLSVENRHMDPHLIFKNAAKGSKGCERELNEKRVVQFTVCIPPMFEYGNAAQLVEKLEMVRLLGAGRVVLYDTSIESNVRSVLELYTQEWAAGTGTLEVVVLSWKLPRIPMHYKGQIAAMDDCLYRYGWLSHYMVFDDLDEIMIPLRHDNWSQLIADREKARPGSPAFMFRCSVMNKDHSSPPKGFHAAALLYQSSVLSFTQRDTYIYDFSNKGKLIVNPRKMQSLEVHNIYEANGTTDVIPVEQGILYHYRWPLRPCDPEIRDTRVATKFGLRLLQRLRLIWSKLEGISKGDEILRLGESRATCKNR